MNRPMLASVLAVGLLVVPSFAVGQQIITVDKQPPRTFSEFAGTWVPMRNGPPPAPITKGIGADPLNCTTSPACRPVPGFDPSAPPVVPQEPKLVITTTATAITLARTPLVGAYGPDVYRFDGVPTNVQNGQGTLTLAAGSLILTKRSTRVLGYESTIVTTDMLSVSDDVLTIDRQYFRIVTPLDGDKVGHIAATNEGGDAHVKMVYRRQAAPAQ
jgi:hypothetical protein